MREANQSMSTAMPYRANAKEMLVGVFTEKGSSRNAASAVHAIALKRKTCPQA